MPITYDSATNTITITGGTEDTPLTFEDIYQADLANGWGVFTKLFNNVYKTTAKIQIGDGATETWFADKAKTVIFDNVSDASFDNVFNFKANSNVVLGQKEVTSEGFENYKNGCTFIINNTLVFEWNFLAEPDSNVYLYNCVVKILANRCNIKDYYKEIKGCHFETLVRDLNGTIFEYNVITGSKGYLENIAENVIIDNVFIKTTEPKMIWCVNNNAKFTNVRGSSADGFANIYRLQYPNIVKFVNCKPHNWNVRWYLASGQVSGELHRIYAVKFKIVDKDGNPLANRTVKVYNKNGDKIAEVTTDENGLTDETEILYAKLVNPYADDTWHEFGDEDWEYFNPFTVEVWYASELEYKGILTDLDVESTFIQITVKPSSITIEDLYNLQDKIRKYLTNRWKIENNRLIIYDDDGITPILKFNLYDKFGNPTEINVYERKPVK